MRLEGGQYHLVRNSVTRGVALTRCVPPIVRPRNLNELKRFGEVFVRRPIHSRRDRFPQEIGYAKRRWNMWRESEYGDKDEISVWASVAHGTDRI